MQVSVLCTGKPPKILQNKQGRHAARAPMPEEVNGQMRTNEMFEDEVEDKNFQECHVCCGPFSPVKVILLVGRNETKSCNSFYPRSNCHESEARKEGKPMG